MRIKTKTAVDDASYGDSGSLGSSGGFDDRGMEENAFPIDCLPGIAGEMAREIARISTCRSESLAATSVLGITSASIGASLEVISGPDRRSRANLFLLAVAGSGTGKTESFQPAAQPLNVIEANAKKLWEENDEPEIRIAMAIAEARFKKLTERAARADDAETRRQLSNEMREVGGERIELSKKLSSRPCFRVSDVTKEQLAYLMQGQPGEAIASISSEARGIISILNGRYSPGGDIDFYCGAYSGDASTVDRVKDGQVHISLKSPCLSVFWMMQPDVVRKAFSNEAMTVSGFLPRFILFDSQAEPQERFEDPEPISPSIKEQWGTLVRQLCSIRATAEPSNVPVSRRANELFREFENENIRRRKPAGDLVHIAPFVSRWSENAWRLGLVLHALTHGKDSAEAELSAKTAEASIRLMRWFSNAQLDFMTKTEREHSLSRMNKLMEHLRQAESGQTTMSLLYKNHGFPDYEVKKLIRLFPNKLLITIVQSPNGGPRKTIISLNPNHQNPQNSKNPYQLDRAHEGTRESSTTATIPW